MWRTPVEIEASLLKICHNISPCHPYATAVILLSWVLMEALWFHGSRFINLPNLINSHLKDSSPIGFDVSIKLWKILKQCKKVCGFYRDKLYQNQERFNDATPGFQCRRCNWSFTKTEYLLLSKKKIQRHAKFLTLLKSWINTFQKLCPLANIYENKTIGFLP